jgi:hypothetical protein
VNGTGSKTDPKRSFGGGDKRGIVGCNPLLDCTISGYSPKVCRCGKTVQSKQGLHPTARSVLLTTQWTIASHNLDRVELMPSEDFPNSFFGGQLVS